MHEDGLMAKDPCYKAIQSIRNTCYNEGKKGIKRLTIDQKGHKYGNKKYSKECQEIWDVHLPLIHLLVP